MQFENLWLPRYPRPVCCLHDRGTEFIGVDFQRILHRFGIKDVATRVHNPQSNAICKRLHQSVGIALHIYLSQGIPSNVTNVAKLVNSALATALHASQATIHCTVGMTPGGIVFNRDMFLNIPLLTDFHLLQARRQVVIDDNLQCDNQKRRRHDYQPGGECLILDHKSTTKLDTKYIRLFSIIQTHTNGTITIQWTPHVIDRLNIQQIKPYFRNV
jgi:hypothetical protein